MGSQSSNPDTLDAEFIRNVGAMRKAKKLHARVISAQLVAVHELFRDWVCIPKSVRPPGGRNDAVLFKGVGAKHQRVAGTVVIQINLSCRIASFGVPVLRASSPVDQHQNRLGESLHRKHSY